ncbi:MAG TPA: hypothetical protein VGU64_24085, partial [Terriglobales bacterium]|nr:hypothetical protein [Terriglobales bacterium]
VYVNVPAGPLDIRTWLASLKQGRTFATNGPLLRFTLGGRELGDQLRLLAGDNKVKFTASLRSIVPIDHLQVICNGQVARDLKLNADRVSADIEDAIPISHSGWCLLRAWSEKPEYPVLDLYPYATTSPVYVSVAGSALKPAEDASYFLAWIDRMIDAVKSNQDWNTEAEKNAVLRLLSYARSVYQRMEK